MRLILNLASLFLRGTALMLCLTAAIVSLAGLGGVFSDGLDALNHGAPVWVICGLLGLALAAAASRDGERKALIGLAAVGIVAAILPMTPELFSTLHRPAKPAGPASTLKLVQFNLWAKNQAPRETADWILAQNADVVVTEESGSYAGSIVHALKAAYPYHSQCGSKYSCDTLIYSRWPIVDERARHEPGTGPVGVWATLGHPGGDFTVVGNHFVWPIPAGQWQAQSRLLQAKTASFPHDSLIVTGDFNSTPWSWGLRRQDKALGLERRTRALASWPTGQFSRLITAPFPILPIDQVYAGKAWRTVKVERGPTLGSDHRPVVVTLAR